MDILLDIGLIITHVKGFKVHDVCTKITIADTSMSLFHKADPVQMIYAT